VQVQDDVHLGQTLLGQVAHALLHQVRRLEQPGQVVQHHLRVILGEQAHDGSRVACAFGLTMARWVPTSRFSRDDLPTLGTPANPTWPHLVMPGM